MIAFKGCWYPLYDEEPPYEEKVEDGMIMMKIQDEWHPIAEAVQDHLPFYDLTDYDFQQIFYPIPAQDLYEVFHDPPEDPLDYDDPDADDPYDLTLAAY